MSPTTHTGVTGLLQFRTVCYVDSKGQRFRSLTLSDEGWAQIEAALETAASAITEEQVREAALAELADWEKAHRSSKEVAGVAIRVLCRRLGVTL